MNIHLSCKTSDIEQAKGAMDTYTFPPVSAAETLK